MTKSSFASIAVLLLVMTTFEAASEAKIPVEVQHSGEDQVGKQLAFELKEAIRASQSMRLVTLEETAAHISVAIVSLDPSKTGLQTIAATSFAVDASWLPLGGVLITSTVETCGSRVVQDCSRSTLANIDEAIETVRTQAPELWQSLSE